MNVNKYFSFAIVVFLMAVPLVLTSCGKDNILDDVEELQPELKVWTEPYHVYCLVVLSHHQVLGFVGGFLYPCIMDICKRVYKSTCIGVYMYTCGHEYMWALDD